MAYALQQLINGVTLGMIYGLIAVGYTMVYGIIGMINFAHGDVFMIGAFLSLIALLGLSAIGITSVPLALALTLLFAAGITALYGWTVERIAYRLTAPGIGREVGSYAASYQPFYQGLFLAPHTVAQAVKTATLAAAATSPTVTGVIPACTLRRQASVRNRCQALAAAQVSTLLGPIKASVAAKAPPQPATRSPIRVLISMLGPGAAWASA